MSILQGLRSHYHLFGYYGVLIATKARWAGRPLEITVAVDGIKYPIHLRLRTTDVSLFSEIILNAEYDFEPSISPRMIIDAGANVGLSPIFYANRYPQATIIAIEPESSNFAMLKKNTAHYSNIRPIQGALWKENATLKLVDPGLGPWGYQTQEFHKSDKTQISVRGMTVDRIMAEHDCKCVDILKVDIEGSEKEVFENSKHWMESVRMIAIETHDRFKAGCERSVRLATKDFEVGWQKGETLFFVKNAMRQTGQQSYPQEAMGNIPATTVKTRVRSKILAVQYYSDR